METTDDFLRELRAKLEQDLDPETFARVHIPLTEAEWRALPPPSTARPDVYAPSLPPTTPVGFDPALWADLLTGLIEDSDPQHVAAGPSASITGRRDRLRKFLLCLDHGMAWHPELRHHRIRNDLKLLGFVLDALNFGKIHPLLRREPVGNNPTDNRLTQQFRATVLHSVDLLVSAGMKKNAAFEVAAKELSEAGIFQMRANEDDYREDFKPATIKGWYYAARAGGEYDGAPRLSGSDSKIAEALAVRFARRQHDSGKSLPPSLEDALKAIRAGFRDPIFRELTHMSSK